MQDDLQAARLIAEIHARWTLTQTQLANRAGIPRPVVSAYQHGRRQPSVAILSRLARAAGLRLRVEPPIDLARNAARFVDALSLVDAMPARRRHREQLPRPVVWAK